MKKKLQGIQKLSQVKQKMYNLKNQKKYQEKNIYHQEKKPIIDELRSK